VSIPPKSTGLRRTAVNIGLTFGRQFLAGFLQLGLLLIVARLLGPEGAGAFAIALLLPSIMSQLLNLGLVSATVYFVASGQVRPEIAWAASRDLMLGMALTGLGVGALIVLGSFRSACWPDLPRDSFRPSRIFGSTTSSF
jgi:O-antigen/teichoic acid export membrane protein